MAFTVVLLLGNPGDARPYIVAPLVENTLQAAYEARSKGRMREADQLVEKAWEQIRAAGPAAGDTFVSAVQRIAQFRLDEGSDLKAEAIYKSALDAASAPGERTPVYRNLLSGLGQLYVQEQRVIRAQQTLERQLVLGSPDPGTDPWMLRNTLWSLANLYEQSGKYTEAEGLFKRMAETRYKSPAGDETVAPDVSALAQFYWRRGRADEAERMMREALAEAEREPGPNNSSLLNRLNELISVLRASQRYAEAEDLQKRAVAAMEAAQPAVGWPGVRYEVQVLSDLYFEAGDYAQSVKALENELSRLADLKGVQSLEYRQGLLTLAGLQSRHSDYAVAEETLQDYIAAAETSGDAADAGLESALWQLEQVYESAGQPDKAREARGRAMARQQQREGPNAVRELEHAVEDAGRAVNEAEFDKAQDLITHALAMAESSSGPPVCYQLYALFSTFTRIPAERRAGVAASMAGRMAEAADRASCSEMQPQYSGTHILIEFHKATGDWAGVEGLLRLELDKLIAAKGSDSPGLVNTLEELSRAAQYQDKPGQAESYWLEDIRIQEEARGPDHPALIQVLKSMAWFYEATGQPDKAEATWQCALALSEKSGTPTDPGHAFLLAEFADRLANRNELDRADAYYRQAVETLRRAPGYASGAAEVESRHRRLEERRAKSSAAAANGPSPALVPQIAPR